MTGGLLTRLRRQTEAAPVTEPVQRSVKKTVFIVDDDPLNLRSMCLALADEYSVDTAGDAESALRKLSSCQPDLILLDPGVLTVDGTRLSRHLLASEPLVSVPIVELAASGPAGPFDGSIPKPLGAFDFRGWLLVFFESFPRVQAMPAADPTSSVTPESLFDAIEAGLPDSQFTQATRTGLRSLADALAGECHHELVNYVQQAEQLSNCATSRARTRFRSVIVLCRDNLLRGSVDVASGLADMRARYIANRRTQLASLDNALKNGDFTALADAGHNLGGTGGAYGFSELTDAGRSLEAAAKDNNAEAVEAQLDRIDLYLSLIRNER